VLEKRAASRPPPISPPILNRDHQVSAHSPRIRPRANSRDQRVQSRRELARPRVRVNARDCSRCLVIECPRQLDHSWHGDAARRRVQQRERERERGAAPFAPLHPLMLMHRPANALANSCQHALLPIIPLNWTASGSVALHAVGSARLRRLTGV